MVPGAGAYLQDCLTQGGCAGRFRGEHVEVERRARAGSPDCMERIEAGLLIPGDGEPVQDAVLLADDATI